MVMELGTYIWNRGAGKKPVNASPLAKDIPECCPQR